MEKNRKGLSFFLGLVLALAGFYTGWRLARPTSRVIDAYRMTACLRAYVDFKKDGDQEKLQQTLRETGFSPRDFERIIDRFIHYRTSRSALQQAEELLEAFRSGHRIEPEGVYWSDSFASEPFSLDAEILSTFQEHPDLVREAFGG
jgi:hypothetical protein